MTKRKHTQRNWSPEEIEFLKTKYSKLHFSDIAKILNRSRSSVSSQIHYLGLYSKYREKIKPLKNLSETDKAYIAAFIDGEGCLGTFITYRNNIPIRANPVLTIANTNEKIIIWIAEKVIRKEWFPRTQGTYFYKKTRQVFQNRGSWKSSYRLEIYGHLRLKPLLEAILPYLRIKRSIALEILKFYESRVPRRSFSLKDWKHVLKIRELTDSYKPPNIRARKRLAQFIKELERKEQNQ